MWPYSTEWGFSETANTKSQAWGCGIAVLSVMESCTKTHSTKLVVFALGVTQRFLQIYSSFAPSPLQIKCCLLSGSTLLSSPLPFPILSSVRLLRLTSLHACSRTCWWCSCSGLAPSSCRRPPDEGRRSLAPGRRRAPRSGSPSAVGHPSSVWPPRCFSNAGSSTSRPVGGAGVVCWGVWRGKGEGRRDKKKGRERDDKGQLCDE